MKCYKEQLQECTENGTLQIQPCPTCGRDQLICQKYSGNCESGKCQIERFFDGQPLTCQGYTAEVVWDAEAQIYYGHVVGTQDKITFQAEKLEEIEQEFQKSVDVYFEFCRKLKEEPETPGTSRAVPSHKLPPIGGRGKGNQG